MKRILISGITFSFLLGMGQVRAQIIVNDTVVLDEFTNVDPTSTFYSPEREGVYIEIINGQVFNFNGDPRGVSPAINNETGLPNDKTLGGKRSSTVTQILGNAPTTYSIDPFEYFEPGGGITEGYLSLNNNSGADSDVTLTWNNSEGNGINLTDKFIIRFLQADLGTNLRITVSNGTRSASLQQALPINVTDPVLVEYSYNQFTGDLNVFNGPNTISLFLFGPLTGAPEFDVAIDYLRFTRTQALIVPEPSLIVGSTIALGLGMWSTKRKRQS